MVNQWLRKPRHEAWFEGVRVEGRRVRPGLEQALATRGEIAYSAAPGPNRSPARQPMNSDSRSAGRSRLRLRSGKIIVSASRFLCECRIHDRSPGGMRLALSRNLGLPGRFRVFEDETGVLFSVVVVWRRGAEIGVRFCAPGATAQLKPSDRFALRERYYAVPDR